MTQRTYLRMLSTLYIQMLRQRTIRSACVQRSWIFLNSHTSRCSDASLRGRRPSRLPERTGRPLRPVCLHAFLGTPEHHLLLLSDRSLLTSKVTIFPGSQTCLLLRHVNITAIS